MPSPPTACAGPTCVQHALYIVARPDSQFVYTCVHFAIFCGLRLNHILMTCSHMHLTAPCSACALGQARPTMLYIHLVMHPVCSFKHIVLSTLQPLNTCISQEHFTNFYNLSGAVSILLKRLPELKVTEIKQSGGEQ